MLASLVEGLTARLRAGPTLAALLGAAIVLTGAAGAEAAPKITVFGDSYSQVPYYNYPNWVTQLKSNGTISGATNFARGGATAASIGSNTFASQISRWRAAGRPVGGYTVVFLGINDITRYRNSFTRSRAGYVSGIKALRDAGARLILVQPHDLGTAPLFEGSEADEVTRATRTWNSFVRTTAASYRAATVDLFKALGNISQDRYYNALHLGQTGQGQIARAIGAKLRSAARTASVDPTADRRLAELAPQLRPTIY